MTIDLFVMIFVRGSHSRSRTHQTSTLDIASGAMFSSLAYQLKIRGGVARTVALMYQAVTSSASSLRRRRSCRPCRLRRLCRPCRPCRLRHLCRRCRPCRPRRLCRPSRLGLAICRFSLEPARGAASSSTTGPCGRRGAAGEALDAAIVVDSVQLVGLIRSHRVQPSGF